MQTGPEIRLNENIFFSFVREHSYDVTHEGGRKGGRSLCYSLETEIISLRCKVLCQYIDGSRAVYLISLKFIGPQMNR